MRFRPACWLKHPRIRYVDNTDSNRPFSWTQTRTCLPSCKSQRRQLQELIRPWRWQEPAHAMKKDGRNSVTSRRNPSYIYTLHSHFPKLDHHFPPIEFSFPVGERATHALISVEGGRKSISSSTLVALFVPHLYWWMDVSKQTQSWLDHYFERHWLVYSYCSSIICLTSTIGHYFESLYFLFRIILHRFIKIMLGSISNKKLYCYHLPTLGQVGINLGNVDTSQMYL